MTEAADDMDRLTAFDVAVTRIYGDTRMPPGTRELALAMAWAMERAPRPPEGPKFWTTVKRALGVDIIGRPRMSELIAADAPRYERPGRYTGVGGACEGPRVRPYRPAPRIQIGIDTCLFDHHPHLGDCRFSQVYGGSGATHDHTQGGTICGSTGSIRVPEADMVTGWITNRWFCRRHKDRSREVREQLAARGTPPEPIPNTGGILPRHFASDWATLYGKHCEKTHARWEVPYYGVDADDWPVPGRTAIPKRPRLALVVGEDYDG